MKTIDILQTIKDYVSKLKYNLTEYQDAKGYKTYITIVAPSKTHASNLIEVLSK